MTNLSHADVVALRLALFNRIDHLYKIYYRTEDTTVLTLEMGAIKHLAATLGIGEVIEAYIMDLDAS